MAKWLCLTRTSCWPRARSWRRHCAPDRRHRSAYRTLAVASSEASSSVADCSLGNVVDWAVGRERECLWRSRRCRSPYIVGTPPADHRFAETSDTGLGLRHTQTQTSQTPDRSLGDQCWHLDRWTDAIIDLLILWIRISSETARDDTAIARVSLTLTALSLLEDLSNTPTLVQHYRTIIVGLFA